VNKVRESQTGRVRGSKVLAVSAPRGVELYEPDALLDVLREILVGQDHDFGLFFILYFRDLFHFVASSGSSELVGERIGRSGSVALLGEGGESGDSSLARVVEYLTVLDQLNGRISSHAELGADILLHCAINVAYVVGSFN